MSHKKKESWRIVVGIVSAAFIVFMWIDKDVLTMFATMPKEQVFPLAATTVAVTLIKVVVVVGLILLVKWIVDKIKRRK